MDDNYEKLKLPRSASQEDIKKAYRKLSYCNHPDRGGSMERFTEILDAYAVLNKKKYKHRSETFIKYYNKDNEPPNKKKCSNIVDILDVTLEQLYNRETIYKLVLINVICNECHGIGITEKVKICKKCDSINSDSSRSGSNSSVGSEYDKCSKCDSDGYIVRKLCACFKCKGTKILKKNIKFTFKLNHKLKDERHIIYYNNGNEYPKYERGNILFVVKEQKHDIFTRVNKNDLYIKYKINLVDALSGFVFRFEHLDGRKIYSDIQNVIKPGCKKILNEGMRKNKSNLIVEFIIEFPRYQINVYERMQLEKITMLEHTTVDINPEESEHCYITHSYNPFRNDENLFDTL